MNGQVSVVVPCKNEEATLARCLAALREQQPAPLRIVVVDNGSTDASPQIAARMADQVLRIEGGTVAGLRNAGAAVAGRPSALGFVDADCEVAPGWVTAVLDALAGADLVGARLLADPAASWVARRWAAIEASGAHQGSQVWSGQLAINRAMFDRIGGFDDRLSTGEDSDLGLRVRTAGGKVRQVPGMVAVHHGFPGTLRAYWRRELWHSRTPGWFTRMSLRSRSLVLVTAAWYVTLPAVVVVALATGAGWSLAAAAGGWAALTAAAVPVLGAVAGGDRNGGGRRLRHSVQDGTLLGLWATVRAGRLPGELRPGRRARQGR